MELKQLVKQPNKKIFDVSYYVAQTGNKLNNVKNGHENTSYFKLHNSILSKEEFRPKSGSNCTQKTPIKILDWNARGRDKTLPLATKSNYFNYMRKNFAQNCDNLQHFKNRHEQSFVNKLIFCSKRIVAYFIKQPKSHEFPMGTGLIFCSQYPFVSTQRNALGVNSPFATNYGGVE